MKCLIKNKINLYSTIFLILFTLVLLFIRVAPCSITPHKWELMYEGFDVKVYKCVKCRKERFEIQVTDTDYRLKQSLD